MAKPESDTGPMMYSNTLLVYSVVTEGRKPQIWPCFQLQHLVVAPASGAETKSNTTAQLQTFPLSSLSKLLLYSNVNANSIVQKRDGQNKQKIELCHHPGKERSPSNSKLSRVIQEVRTITAPLTVWMYPRVGWGNAAKSLTHATTDGVGKYIKSQLTTY